MKKLMVLVLALASFSAMASGRTAAEVIADVEAREGVSCTKIDESRFKLCIGQGEEATCRWNVVYDCYGASRLTVTLKLKSEVDYRGDRITFVTKTSIKR
jgi:hypothetical protein